MNINEVIKYPILSEKSYQKMSNGVYTFAVDFKTNKTEVKKVVEYIFSVKVKKVNIMFVDKKEKKIGKFKGFTNRYKKAIITLKKGDVINIFPEEIEEKTKKITKKEISKTEKKAAAKIAKKLKKQKNQ
jgi:large subunit ribosomal protein L23